MSKTEQVGQKPPAVPPPAFEPAPRAGSCLEDDGAPQNKRQSNRNTPPKSCDAGCAHDFAFDSYQKTLTSTLQGFSAHGCSRVLLVVCICILVFQAWKLRSQTWRMEVQEQDVEVKSMLLREEQKQLRQTKQYLTMEKHQHEKELSHLRHVQENLSNDLSAERHQHEKKLSHVRHLQEDLSKDLSTERLHHEEDRKQIDHTKQKLKQELGRSRQKIMNANKATNKAIQQKKEMERKLAQAVENARQTQVRFRAAEARGIELQREADQMALETLRQREVSKKNKAEKKQISKESSQKQTLIESIQKQIVDAKLAEDELRRELRVERSKVQASESLVHESNATIRTLHAELQRERTREKQLLSKMINETSEIKHLRKNVATGGHKLKEEQHLAAKYRERAKQEQARALAIEALRDNDQQAIENLNAQLEQQVSDSDMAEKKHAEEHARQSEKDADLIRHLQQTLRAKGAEVRELRVKVQKEKLSEKEVVLSDESPATQKVQDDDLTQKVQDDDLLEDSLAPISHHAGDYAGGNVD